MWLQAKFLELFKKPIKNIEDNQDVLGEDQDSAPDIFDEKKNSDDINKEEK